MLIIALRWRRGGDTVNVGDQVEGVVGNDEGEDQEAQKMMLMCVK